MKRKISILLLTALLISSCSSEPQNAGKSTQPIQQTISIDQQGQTIEKPVYVYENALRDYLSPVNSFSWERQYAPEYVMLHFCSAVVEHPEDPYKMKYVRKTFVDADVSVHYIVERDGTVHCYIPEDRVAWHAGPGTWNNDEKYTNKMNYYAIGIEILAIGSELDMARYLTQEEYEELDPQHIGYTEAQYQALKLLIEDICRRNQIPMDAEHVIGHEAYTPGKTDPGELFDWDQIFS